MMTLIGIILFLILLLLSSIHFYWGFGGRWASKATFPTKDDHVPAKKPGALPTFIVALSLMGFGLLVLINAGLINLKQPAWLEKYGLWVIAGIFILRAVGEFRYVGFFKKYSQTKFGRNDTKYYSPLSLAIGILILILKSFNLEITFS